MVCLSSLFCFNFLLKFKICLKELSASIVNKEFPTPDKLEVVVEMICKFK